MESFAGEPARSEFRQVEDPDVARRTAGVRERGGARTFHATATPWSIRGPADFGTLEAARFSAQETVRKVRRHGAQGSARSAVTLQAICRNARALEPAAGPLHHLRKTRASSGARIVVPGVRKEGAVGTWVAGLPAQVAQPCHAIAVAVEPDPAVLS
jgi:hypothetical protein